MKKFDSVGVGPGFTGGNCAFTAEPNTNRAKDAAESECGSLSIGLHAWDRSFYSSTCDRVADLRARGAQENLLSIRERDVAAVGAMRSIFGLKPSKMTSVPMGMDALGKTMADERVRRAPFDHPFRRGSIGVLHRDVKPGVRIDHFDFHNACLLI